MILLVVVEIEQLVQSAALAPVALTSITSPYFPDVATVVPLE